MLNCVKCAQPTRVLETRGNGDSIARRRECIACKARCTTIESVAGALAPQPAKTPKAAKPKKAKAISVRKPINDAAAGKLRAAARRRMEEIDDESSYQLSESDLLRELGI
jgi:transcriptional regulator NrdR family protein